MSIERDLIKRISDLEAKVRRLETRQGGRSSLSHLSDVHYLMALQEPRDLGAIFAYRATGWDFLHSLRYRALDVVDSSSVTLVPDGTIVGILRVEALVQIRPQTDPIFHEFYYPNRLVLDEADLLFEDTGHELTLTLTAGGGITLQRTLGDHAYTVNLLMFWK